MTAVIEPAVEYRTATLRPLVRTYVNGRVNRREIEASTGSRIRGTLNAFADVYGARIVKNMSRSDIERWLETCNPKKAAATRRLQISQVRGFVRWLQQERHLRNDPMVHIKSPKVPRRVPRALSRDETAALIAVLPDARARAIVALMLGLGLRRVEVLRLQIGDWNRYTATIKVVGKGSHEREIPVPDPITHVLAAYVGGLAFGPMIRRHDGLTPISNSYLGILMRTWMQDAGVKVKAWDGRACHSLRHTIASEIADVEPDLRVVQELLGHANLSATQVYLRHAGLARVRAAMELANPAEDSDGLTLAQVQRRVADAYGAAMSAGRHEVGQGLLRAVVVAVDRGGVAS